MRVITGLARGHRLRAPEGGNTRPTTDKIKESLFNILAPEIEGSVFLDLFSGSGGIGIEALSRGALKAVFVDTSDRCREVIQQNLKFTKLMDHAEVLKQDVGLAVSSLGKRGWKFDLIFMDPPYASGLAEPSLEAIVSAGVLNDNGLIIVEHASEIRLQAVKGLKITREKDYKTTTMTFLTMEE